MTLTDEQLAALARHAEGAPPGPWVANEADHGWEVCSRDGEPIAWPLDDNVADVQGAPLVALMAAAPELLAEVQRLREQVAAMQATAGQTTHRLAKLDPLSHSILHILAAFDGLVVVRHIAECVLRSPAAVVECLEAMKGIYVRKAFQHDAYALIAPNLLACYDWQHLYPDEEHP